MMNTRVMREIEENYDPRSFDAKNTEARIPAFNFSLA